MKGYYNKKQAATVLGITVRQLTNYIRAKTIPSVYQGRCVWIPKTEVDALLTRLKWGAPPATEHVRELEGRIKVLEGDIEVLKLGLGFGAKGKLRGEEDLRLLRQKHLDMLTYAKWSSRQMSQVADDLIGLQEKEVNMLAEVLGPAAWLPSTQLVRRMMGHIEARKEFPGNGLDILHKRLSRSADRFYGLLYVVSKARDTRRAGISQLIGLIERLGPFEHAILGYIDAQK